jgi:GcrA cell cycle regulator
MSWTDDRVNLLCKLWADGLSASQIAAELGGVTRNAVIGKVHRLGLSGRSKSTSQPAQSRARRSSTRSNASQPRTARAMPKSGSRTATQTSAVASESVKADIPQPTPKMISLLQLNELTCRFPVGDPQTDDFGFCGHSVRDGDKYCEYHCRLTYQPAADRKRSSKETAKLAARGA